MANELTATASSILSGPFGRQCLDLGVKRYARELAKIEAGQLPTLEILEDFRASWRSRANPWDSVILTGHTGAGKSVSALDACLEVSQAGGRWDFVDFGQIAMAWRGFEAKRITAWQSVPLLVVDDIEPLSTAPQGAFDLFSIVITQRYRRELPVVLCTEDNADDILDAIGPALFRRFPIIVKSAAPGSSRAAS